MSVGIDTRGRTSKVRLLGGVLGAVVMPERTVASSFTPSISTGVVALLEGDDEWEDVKSDGSERADADDSNEILGSPP